MRNFTLTILLVALIVLFATPPSAANTIGARARRSKPGKGYSNNNSSSPGSKSIVSMGGVGIIAAVAAVTLS
ncbi:hypothetical protein RUND412_003739 [Rhizina undulata]